MGPRAKIHLRFFTDILIGRCINGHSFWKEVDNFQRVEKSSYLDVIVGEKLYYSRKLSFAEECPSGWLINFNDI